MYRSNGVTLGLSLCGVGVKAATAARAEYCANFVVVEATSRSSSSSSTTLSSLAALPDWRWFARLTKPASRETDRRDGGGGGGRGHRHLPPPPGEQVARRQTRCARDGEGELGEWLLGRLPGSYTSW